MIFHKTSKKRGKTLFVDCWRDLLSALAGGPTAFDVDGLLEVALVTTVADVLKWCAGVTRGVGAEDGTISERCVAFVVGRRVIMFERCVMLDGLKFV